MSQKHAGLLLWRGAQLDTGPDLANAAARSLPALAAGAQFSSRLRIPAALDSLWVDACNASSVRVRPASVLVTGTERLSGIAMRVLFRGQLRAVDFCARHILGTGDFECAPPAAGAARQCDVVVTDHPFLDRGLLGPRPALQVPQWLRQRRRLGGSWQQTVENIPQSLRKRIARQLGRDRYEVRLESGTQAKGEFYDRVYLPYVEHRFGPDAIVGGRRAFLHEARDSLLLQLRLQDRSLGAALVSSSGDTLYMGKSALTLDHRMSHVFDLLDYFCFLLAQSAGCGQLDFGVSRPHLEDGVFANKSKWRPSLVAGGGLKSDIRIKPVSRSAATLGFLSRNGFIERRGDRFIVRRLYCERPADAHEASQFGEHAARMGVDTAIAACWGPGEIAPPSAAPRSELQRLEGADPLRAFLEYA